MSTIQGKINTLKRQTLSQIKSRREGRESGQQKNIYILMSREGKPGWIRRLGDKIGRAGGFGTTSVAITGRAGNSGTAFVAKTGRAGGSGTAFVAVAGTVGSSGTSGYISLGTTSEWSTRTT